MITLRDVTSKNIRAIISLSRGVDDELVAPNDLSIAEWLLRDDSWLRAIYVDDIPVGLVETVWKQGLGLAMQHTSSSHDPVSCCASLQLTVE